MKAGWIEMRLGDFCEIYQPKTISVKEMIESGKYPVFGANGIIGRYSKFNHEDPQLLLGCRGSCGFVNVSLPKSWITGNAMVVRAKAEVSSLSFMRYLLQGAVDFSSVITGTAQPQITRKSLSPVKVPIPSLEEQQQIVKILDEAFAGLDEARSNATKNIENCKELFQSVLHENLKNAEQKGWEIRALEEIASIGAGNSAPQNKSLFIDGCYPFIRTADVGQVRFGVINEAKDKLNDEGIKGLRLVPKGTLLMPKSGASTFLNHRVLLGMDAFVSSHLATIEPNTNYLDKAYLLYAMFRIKSQDVLQDQNYPSLNLSIIRQITIPLPPIEEQQQIVEKLDAVRSQTDQLRQEYIAQLADIDELRQSILQKALAGELT